MTAVTTLDLSTISAGFEDPAREAQSVFRKVMDAVARPGSIADLSFAVDGPKGLDCAAAATALTLFDFETPVWLDPQLRGGDVEAWLRFHAGCPLVEPADQAAFAIVTDIAAMPNLADFNQGDAKYPDRSTTLVLQVEAIDGGAPVVVAGPGIKGERTIAPRGLPAGFWEQFQTNNAQFQFGVDVILVAGSTLMALPRSTRAKPTGE
jgi:alpha-D-ribose 1-methylphosphonate 5-triphosphate synthase subunit PhnH